MSGESPWKVMRLATGLSGREVARRLGWRTSGRLSLIEQGLPPTPEQEVQLRELYLRLLRQGEVDAQTDR